MKGLKKICHSVIESWRAIITSEKVDFRARNINNDKEGHFLIRKGSSHQEDKSLKCLYIHNRDSKCMKKNIDPQKRIDNSAVILRDFNTCL